MSKGFREPDFAQIVTDRVTSETINQILEQDRDQAAHAQDLRARGAYGLCEDCSKAIAPERLEALPDATRCVACQGAFEANRR